GERGPLLSSTPSLKIFLGYGLNSAFNLEDYNSGGLGKTYSIPTNFLSLGTTVGSYENQLSYGSATTGTNTYQIVNDIGASSSNAKVKYSTYKIYKLPHVGLTVGSSWDVNVASYTYNSGGSALPPSFGIIDSLSTDNPAITASWSDSSTVH